MGDLVFLQLGPRRPCVRATSAVDWYERGLVLEATDPTAAMTAYGRALAGRPDFADAYNNLGRLHHDLAGVQPAAAANGTQPAAAVNRTQLRLQDAEQLYRLALCCNPTVALYWFNLGVVLEDQRRNAEAIAAYERAIALDASFADAHFNLARQLEHASRPRPSDMTDELVLRRAVRHLKRYRELVHAVR